MNLSGCVVRFEAGSVETRSGRRRPMVQWRHAFREAHLPEGIVSYDQLAVRLLAPSIGSTPFNKKHVNGFDVAHARYFGQEVQVSIKGRSWARLYKGVEADRLMRELTGNGVRGEQALRGSAPQPGVPSKGMSRYLPR